MSTMPSPVMSAAPLRCCNRPKGLRSRPSGATLLELFVVRLDVTMSQTLAFKRGQGRNRRSIIIRIPNDAELVQAAIELQLFGADEGPAAGRYGSCIGIYLPSRGYSSQDIDPFTGARGPIVSKGVIGPSCAFWCGEFRVADTLFRENPPLIHYYATQVVGEQMELFSTAEGMGEEGARCIVERTIFERDPKLRELCLHARGSKCLICGFDSTLAYGSEIAGVIEVHHMEPLSAVRAAHAVDPSCDLIPVCPNCHTVIHRRSPPFTPDEVRALLA